MTSWMKKLIDYFSRDQILVKRLTETAQLPKREHEQDAGADLFADEEKTIEPHTRAAIKTGISIQLPPDCYGKLASRSGLSKKFCVDVQAGIIDQNYRGEIIVLLHNSGPEPFLVTRETKIAQLICEPIRLPKIFETLELSNTDRGLNGFGSTN